LDRIEKMDISFFERTRERYLSLARNDKTVIVIDASQSIDEVGADIEAALLEWLNKESV
jgi:dTMP kinase